jgi:hypothetical protein
MAAMTERSNRRLPDNLARFRQNVGESSTSPELSCHRTREHAPHVEYTDPGAPFDCPGVGDFTQVIDPPADPFAGIPDDEEF